MISPRLSSYLDWLRFVAAVVVLLSHFAYERFTDGFYSAIRDYNLGSDAVVIFFVLSGFVIAHTAKVKDTTLGQYVFNRATRIYSVAIPALLVTFILDRYGLMYRPEVYAGWWYVPQQLSGMLYYGLSFSSEWGMNGERLGTNGPYWSLSYEVAYYALFGVAYYLRGTRRWCWLFVGILVVGPKVLLLIPAWLMGYGLYLITQQMHSRVDSRSYPLWATAPLIVYFSMLAIGTPKQLTVFTYSLVGEKWFPLLRFSDEFLWNAIVGLLFAVHLYAMARVMSGGETSKSVSTGRWLAGASFSLYLVHYPALQFLDAALPLMYWPLRHLLLLVLTVVFCFLFAELFERRLHVFRKWTRVALTRIGVSVLSRKSSV